MNNLLRKTLPLFCPTLAELLSNLKALVQRLFRYLLFRDFAFASENLSIQLVSGFQNKVPRPDFLPEDFRRPNDPVMKGLEATGIIRR